MTRELVVGLFDDLSAAEAVMRKLLEAGITRPQFSFITKSPHPPGEVRHEIKDMFSQTGTETGDGAVFGASTGAVLGGLSGLLSAVMVPGLGAVLAVGPIVGLVTGASLGATAGSLLGALHSLGIPDHEARVYAAGIKHGQTLVAVHVPTSRGAEVRNLMRENRAVDIGSRNEHLYNAARPATMDHVQS